jgi:exodeoxyribonuclease-3
VNGRLPRLLEWLKETSPDIVCLQEIKTTDDKCPARAIEATGYGSIWHGQRSHHGVAILAKDETPKEIRRGLPGDDEDKQARYLEAQVKGLTVASIYLPNGNPQPGPKFDFKLAWFDRLIAHAAMLYSSGKPVLLAGDLNVVPTDFDIYNAWPWREDAVMRPETRDAYKRLLAQGWIDSHRQLHPEDRIYTFWVNAQYFRRNAGFRMDFLLINAELERSLKEAGVDTEFRGREGASDHAPTWITLQAALPAHGERVRASGNPASGSRA